MFNQEMHRLSIAAAFRFGKDEELENEKYKIRKHGKLEYKANLVPSFF